MSDEASQICVSDELPYPFLYHSAPSGVISLTVTEQPSTTLNVSWQPPLSTCKATEYVVVYTLTNKDQCEETNEATEVLVEETQKSVMLTNLLPFSNFTISVRGRNIAGNGPEEMVVWTTDGFGKEL